jgi:uncharacterized membrane protein YfcA
LQYVVLFIVGIIAGWLNTIAGGGSAFMLPLLIFLGLPPDVANGTNRVTIFIQNVFGSAGYRSKNVSAYPFSLYYGLSALIGAIIGARIAVHIPDKVFNRILAGVIVLVVIFLVFRPKYDKLSKENNGKNRIIMGSILFFMVGIYGGFIQVGTGFIILMLLHRVNHYSLVKSNAAKTTIIMIYSLSALLTFAYFGHVHWPYGLTLAAGAAIGAWFGSRWAVGKGDKAVRLFLLLALIIMAVKLWLYDV